MKVREAIQNLLIELQALSALDMDSEVELEMIHMRKVSKPRPIIQKLTYYSVSFNNKVTFSDMEKADMVSFWYNDKMRVGFYTGDTKNSEDDHLMVMIFEYESQTPKWFKWCYMDEMSTINEIQSI